MSSRDSAYIPYSVGIIPNNLDDLPRAIEAELYRIQQSLIDLDRPLNAIVVTNETILADPSPIYERLFDVVPNIIIENPEGSFNTTTGVYTVPTEGLYNIHVSMVVDAAPSPQIFDYVGKLRVVFETSEGIFQQETTESGQDDQSLNVQGTFLYPLNKGDMVYFDGAINRVQPETVNVYNYVQIFRVSSIR